MNSLYTLKRKIYQATGTHFYHITTSKESGYVWFRIAKNGTRSVLKALEDNTIPTINGSNIPYISFRFRNRFKFCFIRNPWDRLVSCYSSKVVGKILFEECWDKDFDFFVDYVSRIDLTKCDRHLRLQTKLFPIKDVDYVGRFENFINDYNYIINERLKLAAPLLHLKKSKHQHFS